MYAGVGFECRYVAMTLEVMKGMLVFLVGMGRDRRELLDISPPGTLILMRSEDSKALCLKFYFPSKWASNSESGDVSTLSGAVLIDATI